VTLDFTGGLFFILCLIGGIQPVDSTQEKETVAEKKYHTMEPLPEVAKLLLHTQDLGQQLASKSRFQA
jgi:hypothetical protein